MQARLSKNDTRITFALDFFFSDTFGPREKDGSEGVAAYGVGFGKDCCSHAGSCIGFLRALAFFFPLVTSTFSSFNATCFLSTLDHCSCFNSPMPGVKVS